MSNNNVSANNSFAAQLTSIMEKGFAKELSATIDWAEFASQMETQNGVNKVVARMEYETNNECSNVWAALYGNTTDTQFIPDKNTEMDQRTRFCARLNVNYWETRRNTYRAENSYVDNKSPEFSATDAAGDMEWANILVNLREAVLNYNRLVCKFSRLRETFEFMTDTPFVFKTYTVQSKKVHPANAKLAAKIMDDMLNRAA